MLRTNLLSKNQTIIALLLSGILVLWSTGTQAQEAKKLFKATCGACHTLGKGRLVGPDLDGVTYRRDREWLISFIKSSQTMIKNGDAEAVKIYEEYNKVLMPDPAIDDAELNTILTYIEENSKEPLAEEEVVDAGDAEEEVIEEESDEPTAKDASKEDIADGLSLFQGDLRFANGGATCASCHDLKSDLLMSGGNLAKDLTDAYTRLGDNGIYGFTAGLPIPAMKDAYGEYPLTDEEIYKITAFLYSVQDEQLYQREKWYSGLFIIGGGSGFLTMLGLIYILYIDRKKKAVKQDIFKRQIKSI